MNKKFVCYLDILGFSKMVENNTHEDVVELFRKFQFVFLFSFPDSLEKKPNSDVYFPNYTNIKTKSFFVSDSILIWSEDNDVNSFANFTKRIGRILNYAFVEGYPLRGSIAYGNFTYEKSHKSPVNEGQFIVGNSLVRAVNMEQKTAWSGCVLDNSCNEILDMLVFNTERKETKKLSEHLVEYNIIAQYPVPMKGKDGTEEINGFAINWVNPMISDKLNLGDFENCFTRYGKSVDSCSVKTKITNTKLFAEYIVNNQKVIFIGTKSNGEF